MLKNKNSVLLLSSEVENSFWKKEPLRKTESWNLYFSKLQFCK